MIERANEIYQGNFGMDIQGADQWEMKIATMGKRLKGALWYFKVLKYIRPANVCVGVGVCGGVWGWVCVCVCVGGAKKFTLLKANIFDSKPELTPPTHPP